MRSCWSLVPILLGAVIGCSPDSNLTTADDPALSHTGIPDITGRIFLRNGERSLCSLFAEGTPLGVRAITTEGGISAAAAVCPANDFAIPVEAGSYMVRVNLPLDQPRGDLPQRWLEPGPVTVDGADVVKDIHVGKGSSLAGRVTLDGSTPVSGLSMSVSYSDFGNFVSGFGVTSPTGTWQDGFFPSSPLILQRGIRYSFFGCQVQPVAGIREVRVSPEGPFLFPDESSRVDCDYRTGGALPYTHQATRLKLTSYPGDIGGLSDPILYPDLGYGYSAQFPLPAGEAPRAGPEVLNRQLFRGGLVLAVAPDVALGGTELEGYVFCSVSPCRTFGFDGRASVTQAGSRKDITWTYSDAGSQRPRGLQISQRSFDGRNGADYVLYLFRITNQGTETVTFTPGLFLDFDVSPDFATNIGYTELGGRLMITTSADDIGRHLGSVIVQSPAGGRNYFFSPAIPESEMVAAIRGDLSSPTWGPNDVSTLHGGTTVSLKKRRSTDFWAAIVAGDDPAQIIANAEAAIADATARQRAGTQFAATTSGQSMGALAGSSMRTAATLRGGRICKSGCSPE